ncbi:MAG: hypothetical protein JWN91_4385 [Nocardioides sp.]|nr:hypothetical protein [Nocardioides sp.]
MGEVLGAIRGERLEPALRRLARWWSVRWLVRLSGAGLALVLLVELALSWGAGDRRPIEADPPSLAEVDASLALAEHYLDGLYRDVGAERAVVSEYYALPLRVYFTGPRLWVRPGDRQVTIIGGEQSRLRESYVFQYDVPGVTDPVQLLTVVRWDDTSGDADVEVSQVGGDADEPMIVELGDQPLAQWRPDLIERSASIVVTPETYSDLKSQRYTIRHVAMMSASAYRYRGMTGRAKRLDTLVHRSGYDPDADVYSPIWGRGATQADGFVFDPSVYRDCTDASVASSMPESPTYYPYQSKVCAIPTRGYVAMSREDPLVPLAQGLHILQRYADPEHEYSDGEHLNNTVDGLVADMERRYRGAGGIAECLPGSCDSGSTSTLRTVLFGMVETDLGFGLGDDTSRTYADAVAEALLDQQVGSDGLIPTTNLGDLYRPDQTGGFYTHVSSDGRSGEPDSFTRRQMSSLASALDIRPEYVGEIATNAETTLAAYAFLVRYRCARFGVECGAWSGDRGTSER